jgi:hypothetical protein
MRASLPAGTMIGNCRMEDELVVATPTRAFFRPAEHQHSSFVLRLAR